MRNLQDVVNNSIMMVRCFEIFFFGWLEEVQATPVGKREGRLVDLYEVTRSRDRSQSLR